MSSRYLDRYDRYEQFNTQEPLLNADETIEFGKELLAESLESRAFLAEHSDKIEEYLQYRDEFQEWLSEKDP